MEGSVTALDGPRRIGEKVAALLPSCITNGAGAGDCRLARLYRERAIASGKRVGFPQVSQAEQVSFSGATEQAAALKAVPPPSIDNADGAAGRPLRIAFIVSFWSRGGAPSVAAQVGAALRDRGHTVEVWYLYRRSDQPLPHGSCSILLDRDLSGTLGYLALPWLVLRRLVGFRADAVISFSPLAHVVGQVMAAVAGVRQRIASHRVVCNQYARGLRACDRLLGSVGGYTSIVAVSEAVRASVSAYPASYRRRVRVIHNGVDRVPSIMARADARAAFGLPGDAPVVLAVGRIAAQKNYPLLISAVARLEGVHLVIAGDGPLRGEIERLAASLGLDARLHLPGHLPHGALSDLFRACDVFALASIFEGQSNALLEAMAEGMPIVASDIPEQVETLRDGAGRDAGLLVPAQDVDAWVHAIGRLVDDPGLRASLAHAASARARHFSVDRMVDGFERVARGC